MQVSDSLFEDKSERTKPLLSLHLDSPIRDAKLKRVRDIQTGRIKLRRQDQLLYSEFLQILDLGRTTWEGLTFGSYPFFSYLKSITQEDPSSLNCHGVVFFSYLVNLTTDLVNSQIKMLPQLMQCLVALPVVDRDLLIKDIDLMYYWKLKLIFEELTIISAVGTLRAGHLKSTSPIELEEYSNNTWAYSLTKDIKIIFGREFVLITDYKQVRWMGVREHLLMLSDVCSQRFMVLLAARLAYMNKMSYYPEPDILVEAFNWGDSILSTKGNEGYDLIGMWESLIIGLLLKSTNDPYVDSEKFYKTMSSDFLEKGGNKIWLTNLENLFKRSFEQSVSCIFQLFGLYRIWGHPTIDSAKGILKLRKLAGRPRPVNMEKINLIYEKFCEYFCMAYYRKNSAWPQIDTSRLPSCSYLKEKVEKNLPIDTNHPSYFQQDWHFIKFKKTFNIPQQYDLSELISDKAMSHSMPDLIRNIIKSKNIGSSAERSVIIQWIQSEFGDPEEFLRQIDNEGFLKRERATGVCPKERELKLFARLFGLLPFQKRMFVVLTESLIATHFLKYFPEITVMNNQTELLKKQMRATSGMGKEKSRAQYIKIVTNVDFNKWNTNMRDRETRPIFQAIDNLLGYQNVVSRTHEMFTNSTMYLADGTDCPEPTAHQNDLKASPYVWRGHLGGIEGLRQKGWTLWTVVILKYVMEVCNVRANLMGQGDNQVIICSYPVNLSVEEIRALHTKFMNTLENFISDLGPPLKREETWESTNLFMYGKYPIYKGCPQPLSLKKISRLMRCSNEGFPTIDSSLSSLSAGFFDSSWMDHSPLIPCLCYTFEVMNSLDLHVFRSLLSYTPYIEQSRKKRGFKVPDGNSGQREVYLPTGAWSLLGSKHKILWGMFLTPRCLGGYPITWLIDVCVRGFPDPVTLALSGLRNWVKSSGSSAPEWQKSIIQNVLHPLFNPSRSFDLLGEDPLSLNLIHPSTPGDQLKRLVFDLIMSPGLTKSRRFMNFLEKVKPNQTPLATYLAKMTPKVNPRIMHEILASTVTSRASQIIQRINKTNTLTFMMIKNHDKDLTKKIVISEVNYLSSVLFQMTTYSPIHDIDCATLLANWFRSASWGLDITGVTVASPLEAFDVFPSSSLECDDSHNRIADGYVLMKSFYGDETDITSSLGPSIPYLGSETIQKVKGYGQSVSKNAAPVLKRISKLLSLIGWGTDRNSTMSQVLRTLLGSITNISADLFEAKFGEVSGSVEHRFHDQITSRGCFLPILYNGASWLTLSTSTLSKYSKGSKNVNLNFQSVMILLESWHNLIGNKSFYNGFHCHLTCPTCIQPVFEGMLDLPKDESITDYFPSYPGDSYFWVDKEQITMQEELNFEIQDELRDLTSIQDISTIFHELTARFLVENFRRTLEEGNQLGSLTEFSQLAVSWIFKMKPINFFKYVLKLLFDHYVYHNTFEMSKLSFNSSGFILFLNRIPAVFYSALYPMTLNKQLITSLVQSGLLIPPSGVPPSLSQWNNSFRTLILSLLQDTSIMNIIIKHNPPSSYPEFYPVWSHLVTYCWSKQITFPQLREFRKWLPVNLLYASRGCVSTRSLFHHNTFNLNHPRYWDSWYSMYQLMSTNQWFLTYSSADYWARFLTEPTEAIIISPIPKIGSLPQLKTVLFSLSHKKNAMGLQALSFDIETIPDQGSVKTGYVSFLKPLGKATTSIYKAISLLDGRINGDQFFPRIMTLGDGAGSFSLASRILSPLSEVIYNTKITPELIGPQGLPGYLPSDFYYYPNLAENIKGIGETLMGISDISHPKWIDQMMQFNPSVIMCDAEFEFNSPNTQVKAILNILNLAQCSRSSLVLFKSYFREKLLFSILCEMIHHFFEEVRIIRSHYSNENGTECYIEGSKLRNPTIMLNVEVTKTQIKFFGASSSKSVASLIEFLASKKLPLEFFPEKDYISQYIELPIDKIETQTMILKFGLTFEDFYPRNLYKAWNHQIKLGSYEEWKAKRHFIITRLKADFLKSLIQHHLLYLGLLVKNPETFRLWMQIINHGLIYLWISKDKVWRSAISFNRIASGEGYCRFRVVKYIKKPVLNLMIKLMARIYYFKIPVPIVPVTLSRPLPNPPILDKYRKRHPAKYRLTIDELPASKRLCNDLFGIRHYIIPDTYISTTSFRRQNLLVLD
ncbi:RdRp [Hymenopteran rhabdo-related virus 23]|uniref:RNA-directed RNA polymerase L n=1 Tax=Hymenopteran rhabdo-related virus 23 TaxID=2847804 RepID=A0AAE9GXH7_9RHAB|nr:RdRp [Hymenopteran rhabdo-related virus]UOS86040.1 RdRp [Hymenopteran rhabdo-related virus 23]